MDHLPTTQSYQSSTGDTVSNYSFHSHPTNPSTSTFSYDRLDVDSTSDFSSSDTDVSRDAAPTGLWVACNELSNDESSLDSLLEPVYHL